jgi:predicted transcriptional regulator
MTTVSFRLPVWLKDELTRMAERQLSNPSAMFRKALLLLLKHEEREAA